MLADFLAYIWPALPLMFFSGLCFILAGTIWWVAIRRHELVMGPDPVIPPVAVNRAGDTHVIHSPMRPEPNHRSDDDTRVIPRIPGATPQPPAELAPELKAVQRYLAVVDAQPIVGLRQERIEEAPTEAIEPTEDAPRDEPTQVLDLCPLTTQDIAIPKDGRLPDYEAAGGTRDLTAARAKFREEERVA